MKRTQFYIPDDLDEAIYKLSQVKGVSKAQVARELLEAGVKKATKIDYTGKTAMRALADLRLQGGPKDLSHNLDHYLYGGSKKDE